MVAISLVALLITVTVGVVLVTARAIEGHCSESKSVVPENQTVSESKSLLAKRDPEWKDTDRLNDLDFNGT